MALLPAATGRVRALSGAPASIPLGSPAIDAANWLILRHFQRLNHAAMKLDTPRGFP